MAEITTLSDACSEIVDCAHKTAPLDPTGRFYAVGTPAMRGNVINYSEARPISKATFDAWTTRLRPRLGDLMLAREAPVGPVVRVPSSENIAPGQRTVLLRPDEGRVDPTFLFYYLTSPEVQRALAIKASGSTLPHLNVADVRALAVPGLPELKQQGAIAGVLGSLDAKIAANTTTVAAIEALMLATMKRVTSRAPLSALARHRTTSIKPAAFHGRVAHFSLPAFDSGVLPEQAARDAVQSNKFLLHGPSVLIAKLNPRIPRIWDIPVLAPGMAVASTEFVVLEPVDCSTSALWASVKQADFSAQLEAKVAGTSGSHQRVRPAEMLTAEVLDPRALSATDTSVLNDLGTTARFTREESAQLTRTREELLPLLMSGRITVRAAESMV